MPISYEAPQPFSEAISYNYGRLQQRERDEARSVASGGGGRGYGGGGSGGDSDIQAAINNRDANAMRAGIFLSDRDTQVNRDVFSQQAQALGQRDRFELQAQLQEVELSQQEKVRLSRMKNAVGEVSADPNLSAEEKSEMILQLKTGIDPYENRLKKQRVAQEQLVKEQMVEQRRAQTALAEEELAVHAKKMEDRTAFVPDPVALAEIAADMRANMPHAAMIPQELIMQMAKQEAMVQGLGTQFFQKSAREWQPMTEPKADGGAAGGKSAGVHPTLRITAQDYMKRRDAIIADVRKDAALTRDQDGTKVPVDPYIQDPKGVGDRVAERLVGDGLPLNLAEFNAGFQAPEKTGKSGYKSKFGKNEVTPDATSPKPKEKPFEWDKPATPTQRAAVDKFEALKKKVETDLSVNHPRGRQALSALTEIKTLLASAGGVDNLKGPERDRFDTALAEVAQALKPEHAAKPKIGSAPAGGYYTPSLQLPRELKGQ